MKGIRGFNWSRGLAEAGADLVMGEKVDSSRKQG